MHLCHAPLLFVTLCSLALGAFSAPSPTIAANATLQKRVTHTGRATWFNLDGGVTACGDMDNNGEFDVAVSSAKFNSGNCNQFVQITSNGKTAFGVTRDICPGCAINDLDLSPALFEQFASLEAGVIPVTWSFLAK
ncbi:hypothetical protein BD410DRAFT_729866 [Rickenella mellea]|uniref:RlpA-like protein double-psi beta-barrel domain-containing protein n=1 Tax=Rickenella mellea TaxID=50990 RepID=A0A4Y7PQW2_9AGAM|nr:hypothetical protein BD410DRAFT_729866 [Rickenella mellea]